MATIRSTRPYTPSQISQYLDHISLPEPSRVVLRSKPDLESLAALQRHHLVSVPFENLALHYSLDRQVPLDPHAVFDKFVTRHRGGYCMEQNLFFSYMLRGLGFTVYSAGSRVRRREHGIPVGDYMGWSHVVNIVALESDGERRRYMVDVGFGGDGPTKPIPMTDGAVIRNLGTQEAMLKFENIDSNVDPGQRLWVYKIRNHEADSWKDVHCFGELEFLPQDFSVMSCFVNDSPASWFTTTVIAVKMLLDEKGNEVVRKEILFGAEVRQNTGGKTQLVRTCTTEEERVEVLKDVFGLLLTEEERSGIKGSVAAL